MHRSIAGTSVALPLVALALFGWGCAGSGNTAAPVPSTVALGTWGTSGAGVIVSDTLVHVHVGCTKGDFRRPETLDAEGRFNVAGTYLLRAYPVALGPTLPARFSGVIRGSTMTLSVAVNDTVEKALVALGPVTIVLGREPKLGICPICRLPAS